MRNRLIVVFLIPLAGLLLVLGGAYANSVARSIQQEFSATQLADLSYFVTSARQALLSGNASVIASEAARHRDLYGTRVLMVDRSGAEWLADGTPSLLMDDAVALQVGLALSGRRGEMAQPALPWAFADAVVVDPVFSDNQVIGAVVIASPTDAPRMRIIAQWATLVVVSVLATVLGVLVVARLATWVLEPIRRVDRAMEAIEKGDIEARIADDTGPPELRRMIGMFNRMADEIERVLVRQQEFVLNASHELRNPLSALLVRMEYLATGLDRSWDSDVEETREEGRRMTRILDTLLNLARSGHDAANLAPVDVPGVVSGRARAWADLAAAKEVVIEVDADAGPPIVSDRTAIEGALDAILDNAVKFSPPASRITVTAAPRPPGWQVSVRDQGPGLAPDELVHATERFWRSTGRQNVPGSGLGLAIANDLMAGVGARVHLSVPESGGLDVTITLPEEGLS